MQRLSQRGIGQVFGVFHADVDVQRVFAALCWGLDYEEIMTFMPTTDACDPEKWSVVAQMHVLITAATPDHISEWFTLATGPLLQTAAEPNTAYYRGTILGMFQATQWLSIHRRQSTFLDEMPHMLAKIVHHDKKTQPCPCPIGNTYFGRELTKAIDAFLAPPEDLVVERDSQLQTLVNLLTAQRIKQASPLDDFLLECLLHRMVSDRRESRSLAMFTILERYGTM